MTVLDKAKRKRAEIDALREKGKKADSLSGELVKTKGKSDSLGKAVKKLTAAEYDALPKSLQRELKEYR